MIESLQLQVLEFLLESRFYIMTKEMVWLCSLFNALNANENDVGAVGTFPGTVLNHHLNYMESYTTC